MLSRTDFIAAKGAPLFGGDRRSPSERGIVPPQEPPLLSAVSASQGQRRGAFLALLLIVVMFVATAPFAQVPWIKVPAFIPVQKTMMLVADLITAALLLGQYSIEGTSRLNVLAAGYLFTALITIPHALTFPGAFSETGLLSSGPQSAAWLYIAWHGGLPIAAIAFGLRHGPELGKSELPNAVRARAWTSTITAVFAVIAVTLLVTAGHRWLPVLIDAGRFTAISRVAIAALLLLPGLALLTLIRKRSALDLWLMVVMFAWLATTTVGAFLSGGRFDVGWYVGLVFDALTSLVVLLMLLHQAVTLYARQFRSAAIERSERERRITEIEAVLAHLSRVSELGQNVTAIAHEVSQPLTAIRNYAAAIMQIVETAPSRVKPLLQRLDEQAGRATEIIREIRNFSAPHETERHVENLREVIQSALRLALAATDEATPLVEVKCSPDSSSVVINRVQIEQVAFNLVRNAIEAMADCPRRILTITAGLLAEGMVEVSVSDTGPGLAPDVRARLFEPFRTTKPGGLGIGLSVCRVIIEAHGGTLKASPNLEDGTTFSFTVPAAADYRMTTGLV